MSDLGPVVERVLAFANGQYLKRHTMVMIPQPTRIELQADLRTLCDAVEQNSGALEERDRAYDKWNEWEERARLRGELRGAQAQSLQRWEGWTDAHNARQQAEADREAALKQRDRAVEALRLHMEWIGPPRTDPESYDSLREDAWRKGRVVLRAQAGGDS